MSYTIEVKGLSELTAKLAGVAGAGLGGRVVVGTNIKYAKAVHDGSAAHTITARNGKALFWKGAAHPVRSVRHPGTKANPFLLNAATAQGERVAQIIGDGVAKLIESGGGSLTPAWLAAGLVVQAEAQRGAPVRTGTLRRSLHTEVFSR